MENVLPIQSDEMFLYSTNFAIVRLNMRLKHWMKTHRNLCILSNLKSLWKGINLNNFIIGCFKTICPGDYHAHHDYILLLFLLYKPEVGRAL